MTRKTVKYDTELLDTYRAAIPSEDALKATSPRCRQPQRPEPRLPSPLPGGQPPPSWRGSTARSEAWWEP